MEAWKNKYKEFPFSLEGYPRNDGTVGARALKESRRRDAAFVADGKFSKDNLSEFFDALEAFAKSKGTTVNWQSFCFDWQGHRKGAARPITKRPNVSACFVQYNRRGTEMQIGIGWDSDYKSDRKSSQSDEDANLWR